MSSESNGSKNKKAKLDVASIAWEHYRNFVDSQEQNDGEGDVDELVELLEILKPHVVSKKTDSKDDLTMIESLLSVLCSVAHCHLASDAINQSVDTPEAGEEEAQKVAFHLKQSLHYYPKNAATWSMGANYARMKQLASPLLVCQWYCKAADCASKLRKTALSLLEGPNQVEDNGLKEWIELLLLDGIVGAEFVDNDEDEKASGDKNENEQDEKEEEEDAGYFSSSSVEATSRFMAAILLSTLGKHDEAKEQLQGFQLTHRLHPNVWTATPPSQLLPATGKLSPLKEPYSFSSEALPTELYKRLCNVLAPDSRYWNESDYAHRGYYSYFIDIDRDQPPTNLIEDVIVNHLLPRAEHVLKSAGDDCKIVGAEWWPHTRPLQANLGHQMHFDTDEALLAQEGNITHPILSSVLYLTGNDISENINKNSNPAGATIVMDQTPDSTQVAETAWKSVPRDNRFIVFPGNKLHGVLPCPGDVDDETVADIVAMDTETLEWDDESSAKQQANKNEEPVKHRLTFMVGFWTRLVPDKMKERRLYGPCGPLPPATEEHSWVQEIQKGYPKDANGDSSNGFDSAKLEVVSLPKVSPAWESIAAEEIESDDTDDTDPPLELPAGIDHRFFVRGAPEFFRESLFQKD